MYKHEDPRQKNNVDTQSKCHRSQDKSIGPVAVPKFEIFLTALSLTPVTHCHIVENELPSSRPSMTASIQSEALGSRS